MSLYSSLTSHLVGCGSGMTTVLSSPKRGQCLPRRSCHSVLSCTRLTLRLQVIGGTARRFAGKAGSVALRRLLSSAQYGLWVQLGLWRSDLMVL